MRPNNRPQSYTWYLHVPSKVSSTKYTAAVCSGTPRYPVPERFSDTPSQERKSQRGKYRCRTFRHALDRA